MLAGLRDPRGKAKEPQLPIEAAVLFPLIGGLDVQAEARTYQPGTTSP